MNDRGSAGRDSLHRPHDVVVGGIRARPQVRGTHGGTARASPPPLPRLLTADVRLVHLCWVPGGAGKVSNSWLRSLRTTSSLEGGTGDQVGSVPKSAPTW